MDETEKTEWTDTKQNTDGTLKRYYTIFLWFNTAFLKLHITILKNKKTSSFFGIIVPGLIQL